MSVRWPPLAVRTWQGALNSRDPEYREFDYEHEVEAVESRRLHELRGLVVGQVAELESLLLHISSEIRAHYGGPLPVRPKRRGAGGALSDLRNLLKTIFLGDALAEELETIGLVIRRRNWLVHGRIHVGLSQLGPHAPLEPVISLLFENDEDDTHRSENNHGDQNEPLSSEMAEDEQREDEDEDVELGEFELKKYLNEAYIGLEVALDIWERVDEALPIGHAEHAVAVDGEGAAGTQTWAFCTRRMIH
jgi:hypothetical protein